MESDGRLFQGHARGDEAALEERAEAQHDLDTACTEQDVRGIAIPDHHVRQFEPHAGGDHEPNVADIEFPAELCFGLLQCPGLDPVLIGAHLEDDDRQGQQETGQHNPKPCPGAHGLLSHATRLGSNCKLCKSRAAGRPHGPPRMKAFDGSTG